MSIHFRLSLFILWTVIFVTQLFNERLVYVRCTEYLADCVMYNLIELVNNFMTNL
jgi:hypothetical protein